MGNCFETNPNTEALPIETRMFLIILILISFSVKKSFFPKNYKINIKIDYNRKKFIIHNILSNIIMISNNNMKNSLSLQFLNKVLLLLL